MYEATEKTITLRGRSKIVVKEGNEDVEKPLHLMRLSIPILLLT